jgi:Holliday junction resolvase-like predicted endonuclease
MLESQLQSKIIKELEKNGYYVLKIIKCNKNGTADLIAFRKSELPIFIEVKTATGIQSELQKYRQKEVTDLGFTYHLVRSLEDFKKIVK